ncbi:MAG: hypothetical protein HZA48_13095 [Planctomycetes bacterium]|nr:hypothetical protein [Planctomycetota bacterium]
MKRKFCVGDVVSIVGIAVYIVFLLVNFIMYILMVKSFDLLAFGQLLLILFAGFPIITLVFSFTTSTDYLRYQYIFPIFIFLIKMANVSTLSPQILHEVAEHESANASWLYGLDLFILMGAFAVAVGTYKAQLCAESQPRLPHTSSTATTPVDKIAS